MMNNETYLAYLGECFVQLELAKRKLKVVKLHGLSFDFLAENGAKLEVKSALPSLNKSYKEKVGKTYEYKFWQFRLSDPAQRQSDFFICVVFEKIDQNPLGFFVFPREAVKTLGKSDLISVFESDISGNFKKVNKENKHQYFNNWELILNFKKEEQAKTYT